MKGVFHFYYYSPKKGGNSDIGESLDQELNSLMGVKQKRWMASQNGTLNALLNNDEITCIHLEEIEATYS